MKEILEFLDKSLTSYHAIEQIKKELLGANFIELSEKDVWHLEAGGAYFLIRKAKKKTKAVKSETIRLKSQIKTLQTSISDMTEGVSDKDLQKSSVLSNSSSLINEYPQSDVIVGASKQHELF